MLTIYKTDSSLLHCKDDIEKSLNKASSHEIKCINWENGYPYCPKVNFQATHDGNNLYLRFTVNEKVTAATQTENNTLVCKDSCVEFFIAFDNGSYYNMEFSCIGTMMLGYHTDRKHVIYASDKIISNIERYTSLNKNTFPEKSLDHPWELLVKIPKESFFMHNINDLTGTCARANIYKCGDDLSIPHYVSYAPIDTEKPDFHRPEFFVPIEFID